MEAKGLVSDRSRSGVDVGALSKGARVSYEMARRYADGLAMPRPDVLDSIAERLDVDPAAMAFGHVNVGIDAVLLEQRVLAVPIADSPRR